MKENIHNNFYKQQVHIYFEIVSKNDIHSEFVPVPPPRDHLLRRRCPICFAEWRCWVWTTVNSLCERSSSPKLEKRKAMDNSVGLKPNSTISNCRYNWMMWNAWVALVRLWTIDIKVKYVYMYNVCLNQTAVEQNFNICSTILKSLLYKVKKKK